MNIYMVSLGCAKNMVDTEMILGVCKKNGMKLVDNPEDADLLMVNTCGFIESAKEEAIQTILELASYKYEAKKLLVFGCLAQRYKEDLINSLPEVDRFISIDEYSNLVNILNDVIKKIPAPYVNNDEPLRALVFDSYYDKYRGVICFIRVKNGCIKTGQKIKFMQTNATYVVNEIGYNTPKPTIINQLECGEVG